MSNHHGIAKYLFIYEVLCARPRSQTDVLLNPVIPIQLSYRIEHTMRTCLFVQLLTDRRMDGWVAELAFDTFIIVIIIATRQNLWKIDVGSAISLTVKLRREQTHKTHEMTFSSLTPHRSLVGSAITMHSFNKLPL